MDFTDCKLKYSYASSIGVDKLNEEQVNKFQYYLSFFRYISLREDVGCQIIKNIIHSKEIVQVLDPTLLLTNEEWSCIETRHNKDNEEFIFVYLAKPSEEILSFARKWSSETGYALKITSTPDIYRSKNDKNYIGMISPEDFIYYLHHSKGVVTNSFHGIAFSINFGKDFFYRI